MDLSPTVIPKSDQLNADDLVAGPVTVTVKDVKAGSSEQPVNIVLEEYPGRVYRPSKGMRRVLIELWGKESTVYKGRRMTLFRNPNIKWAGVAIGGIQISHLSHIDGKQNVPVTMSQNSREVITIQPLVETAATLELEELRAAWKHTDDPDEKTRIEARVAELQAQGTDA